MEEAFGIKDRNRNLLASVKKKIVSEKTVLAKVIVTNDDSFSLNNVHILLTIYDSNNGSFTVYVSLCVISTSDMSSK